MGSKNYEGEKVKLIINSSGPDTASSLRNGNDHLLGEGKSLGKNRNRRERSIVFLTPTNNRTRRARPEGQYKKKILN